MRSVYLLALLGLAVGAGAQETVIYRCTDAKGAVTLQNDRPCPAGSRQEKRVMPAPASAPSPVVQAERRPPRAAAAPSRAAATPATAAAAGAGARSAANAAAAAGATTAETTTGTPATGSAGTSGAGGTAGATTTTPTGPDTTTASPTGRRPPPPLFECRRYDDTRYFADSAPAVSRCRPLTTTGLDGDPALGAGNACETVQDTCAPVGEAALCDGWRARMDQLELQIRTGDATARTAAEDELERIATIYDASTCVVPPGVIPAS